MTVTDTDVKPAASEPGLTSTPTKRPGFNTATVALAAVFIAMFAFVAAVFAVGVAARAVDHANQLEDKIAAGGGAAAGPSANPSVTLTEFKIAPNALTMPASGGVIKIQNAGTAVHNLHVDTLASADIPAGASGQLEVKGLKAGTYKMWCSIVGHEGLGMTGTVTIG